MQAPKKKAILLSVFVTLVLTTLELSVGFWCGAISVIANGIQSAVDLLTALTAWFAIRQSAKPPDADHLYGHGKYESLLGAIEASLIWVIGGFVIFEAISKLLKGTGVTYPLPAVLVMTLSVFVGLSASRYLFNVAKQTDSIALEANAWHLQVDAYAGAVVLVGLLMLTLTGWHFFDPLLAIFVTGLIAKAGFDVAWKATKHLLDAALPPHEEATIKQVLKKHSSQFVNVHRLRTRKAGMHRYIDLHLVVWDEMSVDGAHRLCDSIEDDIRKALPNTDVTIHVEPESAYRAQGDESANEYRGVL